MKVKMLSAMSGPDLSVAAGEVFECEPAYAKRLIDGGHAVAVEEPKAKGK